MSDTHQAMFHHIAFYQFIRLKDLTQLRENIFQVCKDLELSGTVLLSEEGFNGFLVGLPESILKFQEFVSSVLGWKDFDYKKTLSKEISYTRLLVKIKKEIIPGGDDSIRPDEFTGPKISPQELKKWLDEKKDITLLDTRNTYEISYGTFKNATHLDLRHFKDFSKKLEQDETLDRSKPMVMWCTGGIRCEKASVAAIKAGFKEVYHLDGGILKYFESVGGDHYDGSCFVFDKRITLDQNLLEP